MRVPPLFVPMENKGCSDTSNNWAFPALLQGELMFARCSDEGKHPRGATATWTIAPSPVLAQVRGLQLWDVPP